MSRRVLVAHPSAELYGSDRVLLESVTGLIRNGCQVIVTVPSSGPLVERLRHAGARVVFTRMPVLRKEFLSPIGLLRLIGIVVASVWPGLRIIRRSRPDVIFVNTVTIPLWSLLAKALRVPVVCHVHEGESTAPRIVRDAIALPLLLTKAIIANSRFSISVLARTSERIVPQSEVVPNAVKGPVSVTPMRRDLDSEYRVAYFGRLSPRKGVDVAIDAIIELRARGIPASLDIVGGVFTGYDWYEGELREKVKANKAGEFVTFHGFQESIWTVLSHSDVVVVPSRGDEPFGNTAVEAILGGRPVVASASSGLLEATEGYACARTVPPGDPTALADSLVAIRDEWDALSARIDNDVALAHSRHDPAHYHRAIARIVTGAITTHG